MVITAFPPATEHQLPTSLGMAFSQATNLYYKPKYMISGKKRKIRSVPETFSLVISVFLCPLWEWVNLHRYFGATNIHYTLIGSCAPETCSESPAYKLASCELSAVHTCIRMSSCFRGTWPSSLPSHGWQSFSSAVSHLLSFLQSETLLARSLSANPRRPAVVLYCCTFQGPVL